VDVNVYAGMMLWAKFAESCENFVNFWNLRNDPDVLILLFDEMKEDLAGTVRRVAKFMDISPALTKAELKTIESQSTHEAMRSFPGRFELEFGQGMPALLRLSPPTEEDESAYFRKGDSMLIRKGGGSSGEGVKLLTKDMQNQMAERWLSIVGKKTGLMNFSHFSQMLKKERSN